MPCQTAVLLRYMTRKTLWFIGRACTRTTWTEQPMYVHHDWKCLSQSAVVRCMADVHIKLCCMELLRVCTRDNVEEVHSAPLKAHDHWSMHEDIYTQSTTVQFTGWCVLGTHPHAQGTSQCVSWPHHVRLQEQKQKDAHCNAQSMHTCHTTQSYTAEPHT